MPPAPLAVHQRTAPPGTPGGRLAALRADPAARLRSARELAAERPPAAPLPTGMAALDRLLGGGLPRGRLVELVGRRSSGRFAAVLAVLAAATARGETAAIVDLGGGLEPAAATTAGAALERLLWARPERLRQAALVTEMLLTTGFPLVVLDLGAPPVAGGRGPQAVWLRLARTARSHDAALLVTSPYRASGAAAAAVIEAGDARPLWRGRGRAPRLLAGLRARLTLAKQREGPRTLPAETLVLRVPGPACDAVDAAAPTADRGAA